MASPENPDADPSMSDPALQALVRRSRQHAGPEDVTAKDPIPVPVPLISNPALHPVVRRYYEEARAAPDVLEPTSAFWQVLLQQHFPAHELYTVTGASCSSDAIPICDDGIYASRDMWDLDMEEPLNAICVHKYVPACDANLPVLWVDVRRPGEARSVHYTIRNADGSVAATGKNFRSLTCRADVDASTIMVQHGWSRMYGLQAYGPLAKPWIVEDGDRSSPGIGGSEDGSEIDDYYELKCDRVRPWVDESASQPKRGWADVLQDSRAADRFLKFADYIKAHPPWEPAGESPVPGRAYCWFDRHTAYSRGPNPKPTYIVSYDTVREPEPETEVSEPGAWVSSEPESGASDSEAPESEAWEFEAWE